LETVWRSIIKERERAVWQGLIQAAAALLHRERGNRHGVEAVGGAALSAQTVNVSVHGLLLESRTPLRVGQDLRFTLELPAGHGPVRGTGTVVRQAPRGEFGVELTDVEEDGRVRLRRFVEAEPS